MNKKEKHSKKTNRLTKIIFIFFIIVFVCGVGYLAYYLYDRNKNKKDYEEILNDIKIDESKTTESKTERMLQLEELQKENEENKDMFTFMKDAIGSIEEVRFTHKLKNHPVCLTSTGTVSVEMEKVMNQMPTNQKLKAQTVLEINDSHPIAEKIKTLYREDKDELKKYSEVLYAQARLIEGLPVENQSEISNLICEIIAK